MAGKPKQMSQIKQLKKEITRDVKIYAIGLLLDTGLIANHGKELGKFDMKNINGTALKDIFDKAGLASGLQSLRHAAITKFIKLTGGVDISPVFENALKYNVLHKLAFAGAT